MSLKTTFLLLIIYLIAILIFSIPSNAKNPTEEEINQKFYSFYSEEKLDELSPETIKNLKDYFILTHFNTHQTTYIERVQNNIKSSIIGVIIVVLCIYIPLKVRRSIFE